MICAQNLGYRAGGRWLVDGVSLDVQPGQLLALVGPNGAGKSTLLRLLSGEEAPHRGSVTVSGHRSRTPRDWARFRALLAQGTPRAPGLTVRQVLELGRLPHLQTSTSGADRRAVDAVEADLGLGPLGPQRFDTLSGGEAQGVAFARGLVQLEGVTGERYYFLDEPTSALDLHRQLDLVGRLRSLADGGLGVVCVVHDLNLAARFAHRIAVIHQGRLAALGTPVDVLTAALVEDVFATQAAVIDHPVLGHPLVLPLGPRA